MLCVHSKGSLPHFSCFNGTVGNCFFFSKLHKEAKKSILCSDSLAKSTKNVFLAFYFGCWYQKKMQKMFRTHLIILTCLVYFCSCIAAKAADFFGGWGCTFKILCFTGTEVQQQTVSKALTSTFRCLFSLNTRLGLGQRRQRETLQDPKAGQRRILHHHTSAVWHITEAGQTLHR